VLLDLIRSNLGLLGGWLTIAIAAVAVIFVILKIAGKAISASLRMAIIVGTLVVIATSLCVLSALLHRTELPFS
jgi:hypothetical protein